MTDSPALRRITPADVFEMRQSKYRDMAISATEMEELIATAETASPDSCKEWSQLFVEAGTDYLVWQVEPKGYVSEANAVWLLDRITRDGKVCARTELELLVKVLEVSRQVPSKLADFALKQIYDAVIEGSGPLASGARLERGVINRDEVELVRRIIFAMGTADNVGVSQAEADMLFNMNDKSSHAANDPSWNDLFVKAIAGYVVGHSRSQAPSAEEQVRWNAALDDDSSFLSRASSGAGRTWSNFFKNPMSLFEDSETDWARVNAVLDAKLQSAQQVTSLEARWLADRINKDGDLHQNERDLLRYIRQLSPEVDESLQPLLKRVA